MVEVMQALFSVFVHAAQPVGRQLPSWAMDAQLAPLIWIRLQPWAPVAAAAGEAMLPTITGAVHATAPATTPRRISARRSIVAGVSATGPSAA